MLVSIYPEIYMFPKKDTNQPPEELLEFLLLHLMHLTNYKNSIQKYKKQQVWWLMVTKGKHFKILPIKIYLLDEIRREKWKRVCLVFSIRNGSWWGRLRFSPSGFWTQARQGSYLSIQQTQELKITEEQKACAEQKLQTKHNRVGWSNYMEILGITKKGSLYHFHVA